MLTGQSLRFRPAILAASIVLLAFNTGCPSPTSGVQGTRHAAVGKKLGDLELAALTGSAEDATDSKKSDS